MDNKIRVMLCDDSSTMRRLMKTALERDPEIEIIAEACHGRDALDQLAKANPDIVVMDIEMPVMDGVDAVRNIRKVRPTLPIIMFSSLTTNGAEATLDAMQAGANDFAAKPSAKGHVMEAIVKVKTELLPKLKGLVNKQTGASLFGGPRSVSPARKIDFRSKAKSDAGNRPPAQIIAIGVSTGGPDALSKLLSGIPSGFRTPVLIAQHMPPVFTARLADRLTSQTGHKVQEATNDMAVLPSSILIAPGDYHMTVVKSGLNPKIQLNQDPPEHSCRPAADPLFRSVAEAYGKRALAVVLTGMGRDGLAGAQAIHDAGGAVFVQDQKTSVVWGMPGKVVESGIADRVSPIDQMGQEIVSATASKRVAAATS